MRVEPEDLEEDGRLLGADERAVAGGRRSPGRRCLPTSSRLIAMATDEDLMELVKEDDRAAFDVLYCRHRSSVFWLALRILDNRELAADATQEAFVRLWRSRHTYQAGRGLVKWWLLRIVRNGAIDLTRREHDTVPLTEELFDLWVAPECVEDEIVARDEQRELAALLEELPSKQREVLELAYFADLTQTEITKRLGLPRGTIKSRNRMGLQKLRAALSAGLSEWHDPVLPN